MNVLQTREIGGKVGDYLTLEELRRLGLTQRATKSVTEDMKGKCCRITARGTLCGNPPIEAPGPCLKLCRIHIRQVLIANPDILKASLLRARDIVRKGGRRKKSKIVSVHKLKAKKIELQLELPDLLLDVQFPIPKSYLQNRTIKALFVNDEVVSGREIDFLIHLSTQKQLNPVLRRILPPWIQFAEDSDEGVQIESFGDEKHPKFHMWAGHPHNPRKEVEEAAYYALVAAMLPIFPTFAIPVPPGTILPPSTTCPASSEAKTQVPLLSGSSLMEEVS